jgi:hypothetical protein
MNKTPLLKAVAAILYTSNQFLQAKNQINFFRIVNPVHSSSDEFLVEIIEGLKLITAGKELLIVN